MWLLIHGGIKVNPRLQKEPQQFYRYISLNDIHIKRIEIYMATFIKQEAYFVDGWKLPPQISVYWGQFCSGSSSFL